MIRLRNSLNEMMIQFRSRQFGLLYNYNCYNRILKICQSADQYDKIQIKQYPLIYYLLSEQDSTFLNLLLSSNDELKTHILEKTDDRLGMNAMNFAILNDLPEMITLLETHGDTINKLQVESNETILHLAARYNKTQAITIGLQQKIDLDIQNDKGETALHVAIQQGHYESARALVQAGCQISLKNNRDCVPLQEAVLCQSLECVQLLDVHADILRGQKLMGVDVVHLAAQCDSLEILKIVTREGGYLIERESSRDKGGARPIHFAINAKQFSNIEYLLMNKAQVNVQDVNMNTPLHLAVMLNDYRLVSALLDYSPDFTILNKDNLSPIDLASFIQDQHIITQFKMNPALSDMFSNRY